MDSKGKDNLAEDSGPRVIARIAAEAMAQADEVLHVGGEETPCLCCRRRVPLARITVHRTSSIGTTESGSGLRLMAGVCSDCISAGSEGRTAQVAELARAASQVDSLLSLIRHRAELQLDGWWGTVGACGTIEVDRASVELRRAIERLGVRA